jgi:hypothetical protein
VLVVAGRREHVEDRGEPLHRLVGPADHHAVADLEPPDAAARADVHVMDPLRLERRRALLVVAPAAVSAVDDRVARIKELAERVHGVGGRPPGRHHDPD